MKLVLEFVVMVVKNLVNTPEMTDLYTWKLRIFITEIECEPSLLRIVKKKKKKKKKGCLGGGGSQT